MAKHIQLCENILRSHSYELIHVHYKLGEIGMLVGPHLTYYLAWWASQTSTILALCGVADMNTSNFLHFPFGDSQWHLSKGNIILTASIIGTMTSTRFYFGPAWWLLNSGAGECPMYSLEIFLFCFWICLVWFPPLSMSLFSFVFSITSVLLCLAEGQILQWWPGWLSLTCDLYNGRTSMGSPASLNPSSRAVRSLETKADLPAREGSWGKWFLDACHGNK